jgi:eukaryotic-like serine/threonine-protein kinase
VETTVHDPLVGRTIDGRYDVAARIARGGMATVYRARDLRLERQVALKVMHAHLGDDPTFTNRFIREARSAARLSHPSVVQVFDQGNDGDLLYLAMEYLPGLTLRQALSQRRVLTPREAFSVLDPVLDALAAAHRADIVHRDVKPENVILADDGRVKVADFGLAKIISTASSSTGVLMGTVAYLSPELVERGQADPRSDVYAAGIMAFELLTGAQPFTGDVPVQVAYRHVHENVPAPSTLVPALPAPIDRFVLAATARDPDRRPTDAGELLDLARQTRESLSDTVLDIRPGTRRAAANRTTAASGEAAPAEPGNGATQIVQDQVAPHNTTQAFPMHQRLRASLRERISTTPTGGNGPDDGPTDYARRRRRRGLIGLSAVLALTLVLAIGAYRFTFGAYQPTPDLTGQTLTEAQQNLKTRGLKWEVDEEFDDNAAPGTVLRTSPTSGDKVHNHGTVTLFVCQGPAIVSVPKVTGLTETKARAVMTQSFLNVTHTTPQYDDEVPVGHVLATSPGPGKNVANGSEVVLVISNGPIPVAVPDVTGKPLEEARTAVESLSFAVEVTWRYDDQVAPGSVISQNPASGGTAPHLSTITLVVSQFPVPDVKGRNKNEAREILEAAGYTVVFEDFLGGLGNRVRSQNPEAGTPAPTGSQVTLSIL